MRNKFLTLVMIIGLLIISACGTAAVTPTAVAPTAAVVQPTTPPAPTAVPPTVAPPPTAVPPTAMPTVAPVKLQVAIVDFVKDKTDKWLADTVVPAFQKLHPEVTGVDFVWLSWGTYAETVQGYFAAGNGPDIINFGSEFIAQYGDQLADITPATKDWADLKQYFPSLLTGLTWNGKLRGLPWLVAPRAYMCRKDLMKNGGKSPTTFDEAVAQAAEDTVITDNKTVKSGYWSGSDLVDWQEFVSLFWASGGTLYDAKGVPQLNTEAAKTALKFMHDRRRAVKPDEKVAPLGDATGSRLATGDTVCTWGNLWGAPATDDKLWDNIDLTAGPAGPGGKPVVQIFTDWLGIPEYSKNKELAAEFLKMLGSKENANAYNKDFGSFPGRADSMFGFTDNAPMKKMAGLMATNGISFSDVRLSAQLTDVLQKELARYATDTQDLETTVTNIQDGYTKALTEGGKIQK